MSLQLLQDDFLRLSLDDQARVLLEAHAADGLSYTTLLAQLYNCQQWVKAQP